MLTRRTFSLLRRLELIDKITPSYTTTGSRRLIASTSLATMATATTIHLTTPGSTHADPSLITPSSSSKASSLLQHNHDQNHIFFNSEGFHNHIAHHLLAIFALGATPEQIQRGFDDNASYQRPLGKVNEKLVNELLEDDGDVVVKDGAQNQQRGKVEGKWKECLGKHKYFKDFEEYFARRIDEKGWQEVVKENLFAGTERSEDFLVRMYSGEYSHLAEIYY